MPLEIHVRCERKGCDETERAVTTDDGNYDLSSIVDRIDDDRFHFVVDAGWIDAPEGWGLGADDQILCPKHAGVVKPDPQSKGDADASDV